MYLNYRGIVVGILSALTVSALIYMGSLGLRDFDHALVWYAVATVLTAYAVGYRFSIWIQRPPTRMYFMRGLQILFRRSSHSEWTLPAPFRECLKIILFKFLGQGFIRLRSRYRWVMHFFLAGGVMLSFAVVFPLVFGWVHFETMPTDSQVYQVVFMGLPVDSFNIHSAKGFIIFNMLNLGGVLVFVGVAMAAWRRLTDAGELATQTFYEDILPLVLLFTVTLTGLMLTFSYKFMNGLGHSSVSFIHMVTVILFLFYIPFGKLFHIFQRSGHLFVSLYQKAGKGDKQKSCLGCKTDFASQIHVNDLKIVLDQLGFNYRTKSTEGEIHYSDYCPACRRRLLVLSQERNLKRQMAG